MRKYITPCYSSHNFQDTKTLTMKFLHTMVRVQNLDQSLNFYVDQLGLIETKRTDVPAGKFTLIYLATAHGEPEIELTHNWDSTEEYR